jgi:type II secretory pathway pseudopilin PulG
VKKVIRWVAGTVLALTALVAVLYFWQVRPAVGRSRQVRSLADMQTIGRCLDQYKKDHGAYPESLEPAISAYSPNPFSRDGFGGPYFYETRDGGFILVSFGAGSKPDGIDYWSLRNDAASVERVAGQFSADQVLSDRGWLREAGK